jgi:hypothetical protein
MTNSHMRQWMGWTALLLLLSGLLGEITAESTEMYGQTLFVPVYSEIPYGDGDRTVALGSSPLLRPSSKARHTRLKCAFAYCVHFVDHTPCAGSA